MLALNKNDIDKVVCIIEATAAIHHFLTALTERAHSGSGNLAPLCQDAYIKYLKLLSETEKKWVKRKKEFTRFFIWVAVTVAVGTAIALFFLFPPAGIGLGLGLWAALGWGYGLGVTVGGIAEIQAGEYFEKQNIFQPPSVKSAIRFFDAIGERYNVQLLGLRNGNVSTSVVNQYDRLPGLLQGMPSTASRIGGAAPPVAGPR